MPELKIGRTKVFLKREGTYVNPKKDIISVEFTINFRPFFKDHSHFHAYFKANKLYSVIRDIIVDSVEYQLDNNGYRFVDNDDRDLNPELTYNCGTKERLLRVSFSSKFTTDMKLLRTSLDSIEANCNYIQYESGMKKI